MIRPVIVITHASFDNHRVRSMNRLLSQLRSEAPQIQFMIANDDARLGSLWCWFEAMQLGLSTDATHVIWLPDDAIVCRHFGRIIQACIECRPDDVFDCFVNHPDALNLTTLWYSTPDGYTGMGGVMPRVALLEHLEWRSNQECLDGWPNDAGVNTWAMATGRRVYKTTMSLVTHDDNVPSLDGHDGQRVERVGANALDYDGDVMQFLGRSYLAPEEHRPGWRTSCTDLGRTYERTHWKLLELDPPPIKEFWDAHRGHPRASNGNPSLYIATPAYQGSVTSQFTVSLLGELRALNESGIAAGWTHIDDSAIDRCRNRLVSGFMLSDATHMLFWDADNIPTKPGWVSKLIESGHGVVGGAVVQKDGTGKRFAMQLVTDATRAVNVRSGCIESWSLGTGFMLISREAIEEMMSANMSEWYVTPGGPEWNLFSGRVHGRVHHAEDYEFCHKWRELGHRPFILPDIDFVHVGLKAYDGSFSKTVLSSE